MLSSTAIVECERVGVGVVEEVGVVVAAEVFFKFKSFIWL
jgi:hypothetical protein